MRYAEWKNSIEGVRYNLWVCGVRSNSDEENALIIAKTLLKLPRKVREKVLDQVCFIIAGEAQGTVFKFQFNEPQPIGKTLFFILLNFAEMKQDSEDDKMRTVAHEIAHFILGHDALIDSGGEKEADDLIEKWGFKRIYQSYGRFDTEKKE